MHATTDIVHQVFILVAIEFVNISLEIALRQTGIVPKVPLALWQLE